MKKILFAISSILLLSSAANSLEPFQPARYVTLLGGGNYKYTQLDHHKRVNNDIGALGSISVGIRNEANTRYELEFAYRYNKLNNLKPHRILNKQSLNGNASTQAYMFNMLYDFPTTYFLKPYIGAGIGYAKQIFNGKYKQPQLTDVAPFYTTHFNHHTNSFCWQAIAGIACPFDAFDPFGCKVEGIIDYRYFNPRIKSSNDQSLSIGLRTYF